MVINNPMHQYSLPPQPLIQEEPREEVKVQNKPYVSKWQKLAQMLNESDPDKETQKSVPSAPPKFVSLIDADPRTLTPAQKIQRDIEI